MSVSGMARDTPRKTSTMLGRGICLQPAPHGKPRHPRQTRQAQPRANGHDDISHDERVELMMKHNGLTREQAEVERLRSGTKARLERGERIQCVLLSQ